METQSTLPSATPPPPPTTRLSIILRLAFYIGSGIAGLEIFPVLLFPLFGAVVSATLGLFLISVLANVITMRIFDRRPLSDIGLSGHYGWIQNLGWGVLLGAGAAALMLT